VTASATKRKADAAEMKNFENDMEKKCKLEEKTGEAAAAIPLPEIKVEPASSES